MTVAELRELMREWQPVPAHEDAVRISAALETITDVVMECAETKYPGISALVNDLLRKLDKLREVRA